MRFISKYRRYNVTFQRELVEHFATGESHELRQFITCQFQLFDSMLPHEIEVARRTFVDTGVPTEIDGVTMIDPLYRYSVFDTTVAQAEYGFDDETREKMEQFLLSRPEHGYDYVMVEPVQLAPPWPNYDQLSGARVAQTIAKKVVEDGYVVNDVVAYERQHQDRADVIDALEEIQMLVDNEPVFDDDEGLIEA